MKHYSQSCIQNLVFYRVGSKFKLKKPAASGHGRTKGPETEDFWAPIGHPGERFGTKKLTPNVFF